MTVADRMGNSRSSVASSSLCCINNKNSDEASYDNAVVDLQHNDNDINNNNSIHSCHVEIHHSIGQQRQEPNEMTTTNMNMTTLLPTSTTESIGGMKSTTTTTTTVSIHRRLIKGWKEFVQRIEEIIFPKQHLLLNFNSHHIPQQQHPTSLMRDCSHGTILGDTNRSRHNFVLLRRCVTLEEQHSYIQTLIQTCQHLHGNDGLKAMGLEYRFIPCDEHKVQDPLHNHIDEDDAISNDIVVGDVAHRSERTTNGNENDTTDIDPEEGTITFVELAKVKSENFISISNRSDSLLSDDGSSSSSAILLVGSRNNKTRMGGGYASCNADICTTPSLATSTALPYDHSTMGDDELFLPRDGIKQQETTTTTTATTTLPNGTNHTSIGTDTPLYKDPKKQIVHQFCHLCERKLYDVTTNTCVTDQNRCEYIANGHMYELVSRFVQEYAHDTMMQEGNMIWVNIETTTTTTTNGDNDATTGTTTNNHGRHDPEPIRILISKKHPCLNIDNNNNNNSQHDDSNTHRPTLLICTGRGKVRAGIFSRHHLICTGLERSTALPYIHEAVHRNIYIIMIDPNVHGEIHGFTTLTKTMDYLQSYYNNNTLATTTTATPPTRDESIPDQSGCRRDVYIVSHSASGGHFVRYFLNKSQTPFIRNIRAIAFTDSTHNIQWTKGDHQTYLFELLQSLYCIYFRCSSSTRDTIAGDGDSKWYLHPAGEVVHTDSFWRHRFGTIRTVWAGTNEHSQTNWFAHAKIWEHFDQFIFANKP